MGITIKDIAKESGYSVGTVSRVLNSHPDVSDAARAKIMQVVEKYNFELNSNAKHLRQQVQNGIAIIVKGSQNMLFAPIVEQMQGMLAEKGFACLIYYISEMDNEVVRAVSVCRERRPLGIMFLGCNLNYFRERFADIKVPCILVTNSAQSLGFDNLSSVSIDDTAAAMAAVEHIINAGHSKIGILGGYADCSKVATARLSGCVQAFEKHRLPYDATRQYSAAMFRISEGYTAMQRLLEKMPDVTAVFAMADVMAIGAIKAIHDAGLKVPQDISVVGFDGIELGEYCSPQLTTVKQNGQTIGRRSVEILLAAIEENTPAVHETVPFEIIEGESIKQLSQED